MKGVPRLDQRRRSNVTYLVGCTVEIIKSAILRVDEDLESEEIGEIAAGARCIVKAHGTGETGRRLLVSLLDGPELEGWISCENQKQAPLVRNVSDFDNVVGGDLSEASASSPREESNFLISVTDVDTRSSCTRLPSEACIVATCSTPCSSPSPCSFASGQAAAELESPSSEACIRKWTSISGDIVSFAEASSLGLKEEGAWDYTCVDPEGVRLRSKPSYTRGTKCGKELKFGEVVKVTGRGVVDGTTWLCLSDGRGWGFERTTRLRMSEIIFSETPADLKEAVHVVSPRADSMIRLHATPCALFNTKTGWTSPSPSAAQRTRTQSRRSFGSVFKGSPSSPIVQKTPSTRSFGLPRVSKIDFDTRFMIAPGETVRVMQIASILLPGASEKAKEGHQTFFKVENDEGKDGWLPDSLVSQGRCEILEESCTTRWIFVISSSAVPVCTTPSRRRDSVRSLQTGEFVEVGEKLVSDNIVFYKLVSDETWVCETSPSNKQLIDVARKEIHSWVYECCDKQGAALCKSPTRQTSRAVGRYTGEKIGWRQRVVTSERVVANGDAFLHVVYPAEGWVQDGERTMRPVNEMETELDTFTLMQACKVDNTDIVVSARRKCSLIGKHGPLNLREPISTE